MWDLVLLRRIRYPLLSDAEEKKGKVSTLPPKSPIDNVGLGPPAEDNFFSFSAGAEEKG